jgi:DNA-binding NtrC family response regulator
MANAVAPTIFVVDDYDSVRIAITMILERQGFRVLTADGAAAARRIWKEHQPAIDLMLVDISMPTTSGPELVTELMPEGPRVPVIFATGTGNELAHVATENVPHEVILQKPFSAEALIEAIKAALSKRPARGSQAAGCLAHA